MPTIQPVATVNATPYFPILFQHLVGDLVVAGGDVVALDAEAPIDQGGGLHAVQHLAGVVPPAGRRGQRLPVSPIEFNRFVDHIEKTSTEN